MTTKTTKQKEFLLHLSKDKNIGTTWMLLFEASPELANVFYNNSDLIFSLLEKENENVKLNKRYKYNDDAYEYDIENTYNSYNQKLVKDFAERIDINQLWKILKKEAIEKLAANKAPLLIKLILNQENTFNQIISEKLFNSDNSQKNDIFQYFQGFDIKLKINDNNFFTQESIKAIHLAVQSNNTYLTDFLLSNGTDIESKDTQGNTPLFFTQKPEMLDVLKKYNPDLEANNNHNKKAYDVVINKHTHIKEKIKDHNIWTTSNIINKDILLQSFTKDKVSDFKKTIKEHDIDLNMEIKGYPLFVHTNHWNDNVINQKTNYLAKTKMDFSIKMPISETSLLSYVFSKTIKCWGNNKTGEKNYGKALESLAKKSSEMDCFKDSNKMEHLVFDVYKNIILSTKPETQIPFIFNEQNLLINEKTGGSFEKDYFELLKEDPEQVKIKDMDISYLRSAEYDEIKKSKQTIINKFEKIYSKGSNFVHKGNHSSLFLEKMQILRNEGYERNNPEPQKVNRLAWCINHQNSRSSFLDYRNINESLYKNEIIAAACNNNIEEMAWACLNGIHKIIASTVENTTIPETKFSSREIEAIKDSKIGNIITIKENMTMTLKDFIDINIDEILSHSPNDPKEAFRMDYNFFKKEINEENKRYDDVNLNTIEHLKPIMACFEKYSITMDLEQNKQNTRPKIL